MPSASPPAIDYRTARRSGRIRFEAVEDGFTLLIPPLGIWRRERWWLLVGLFLPLLPVVALAIVLPSQFPQLLLHLPKAVASSNGRSILWLPLSPYALFIEGYVASVLVRGYFEGGCSTRIAVDRHQISVTIAGRVHTTNWKCPLPQLLPPRYTWLGVTLRCEYSRKFMVLRYGTSAELRWVCRVLSGARQAAVTSAPSDGPA